MDCLLAEVVEARDGGDARDPRMLIAPAHLDGRARPGAAGKALYGAPLAHRVDTADFTVQWSDESVDEAHAAVLATTIQEGWTRLVVDAGWAVPESADRYLLWVILDPTLGGSGYTTLYTSDEFPAGYPVIYLNPTYGEEDWPGYSRSVAVHEFGHAIQLAMRSASLEESWFWESSSEWMAELGAPDVDTYALSTYWYAATPDASYASVAEQHAYGMLLLPAYVDEYVGEATLQAAWEAGDAAPEDAYEAATDLAFEALLAEMAGAYAGGALRESALYYPPTFAEDLASAPESQSFAAPDPGGTVYVRIAEGAADAEIEGEGLARWGAGGAWGERPPAEGTAVLAYTSFDRASWRLGTALTDPAPREEPGGCGCGSPVGSGPWALVALLAARRRR